MIFVNNKYTTWYYNIIQNAKKRGYQNPLIGYMETHHIIPKSLGGSDDINNLVNLTAKEHFTIHHLLIKMVIGRNKNKMVKAFKCMGMNKDGSRHVMTSRQFENIAVEQQKQKELFFNIIVKWCTDNGHLPNRYSKDVNERKFEYFVHHVSDINSPLYDNKMKNVLSQFIGIRQFEKHKKFKTIINWCIINKRLPTRYTDNKLEKSYAKFYYNVTNKNDPSYDEVMAQNFRQFPSHQQFKKSKKVSNDILNLYISGEYTAKNLIRKFNLSISEKYIHNRANKFKGISYVS